MQKKKFIYLDGSNNKYLVTDTTVHYLPVHKHESSSGTYSGGESKSTSLTETQFVELAYAFKKALESSSDHATHREKGTPLIQDATNNESTILRPQSSSHKTLEELLKRFLSY